MKARSRRKRQRRLLFFVSALAEPPCSSECPPFSCLFFSFPGLLSSSSSSLLSSCSLLCSLFLFSPVFTFGFFLSSCCALLDPRNRASLRGGKVLRRHREPRSTSPLLRVLIEIASVRGLVRISKKDGRLCARSRWEAQAQWGPAPKK